jgi:tetraacyldisaccharide 4'-kinase
MRVTAPAEILYTAVNRARRALYRRGLLQTEALPRTVLSIGNRAIGGSGKTPLTIAIARGLLERGLRVVVLTRGYGRDSSSEPLLVDGEDPRKFGDEPVVIARNAPGAAVVVGSKRVAAGRWFLETTGDCDVFLLDDGFQHLQLERDLDLVIESAGARWFREGPEALRDADVIFRRGGPASEARERELEIVPVGWTRAGEALGLELLGGARVFAFAGLADNDQFFRTLERLGAIVAGSIGFADHHVYRPSDLDRIRRQSAAVTAELIITTEKDAVKTTGLETAVLQIAAKIEREQELLDLLVSKVRSPENFGRT